MLGVALCSFEGPGRRGLSRFSGGLGEGETPLPIPNRAVKPLSADGTWLARAWESRTPPVFCRRAAFGRPVVVRALSGAQIGRDEAFGWDVSVGCTHRAVAAKRAAARARLDDAGPTRGRGLEGVSGTD